MVTVLKFNDYTQSEERALEVIESICNPVINESKEDSTFDVISKKLSNDIKFNFGLIATFGTGIKMMIPIVSNLIANGNLSVESSKENVILLCITAFAITYLEETSNKSGDSHNSKGDKSIVTKRDAQTMLEELKMRGIGQGIVKKFVEAFKSIGEFFKSLFRGTPYVINGLLDMFGYTALLLPCMNALAIYTSKYEVNFDTIKANLLSLVLGATALLAKQGVSWLVKKLKKSLNIKGLGRDLEKPVETIPYDIIDNPSGDGDLDDSKLIKEQ